MLILSIRTDNPDAEIGLFEDQQQLSYETWAAHRQLAETIHAKIEDLLKASGKQLSDVKGIVCYKGPGSFTGLRIGLSLANAIAYGLSVPIVSQADKDWIKEGINRLQNNETDTIALPEYGSAAFVTVPKK